MTNQFIESNSNNPLNEAFHNVFIFENLSSNREPIEPNDSLYFISTATSERIENSTRVTTLFKIEKVETKKLLEKKTNRGRQKNIIKNENNENDRENTKKSHDKNSLDNIKNKIQVDAINCLRKCVNCIKFKLDKQKDKKFLDIEAKKFLDIEADFKKNVKNKEFEKMKETKLCEILTKNLSSKYQKFPKNYNKQLYNEMVKDPNYKILIEFLNEDFLYFFQNIYYKKERNINFLKYGVDTKITLSNDVKLCFQKFQTLDDKDIEYKKSINNCINVNYFDGKLMFLLEE